jgi:hypothetical protein
MRTTSYIVCIPDWFELSSDDEIVKREAKHYYNSQDKYDPIFKEMKRLFNDLKGRDITMLQGEDGYELYAFYALGAVFDKHGFEVAFVDTPTDEVFIENIKVETLDKLYLNAHKHETAKLFGKDKE